MAARQWTPEQKAKQAALIKNWQPWRQSTGPRTQKGKAICAKNACNRYMLIAHCLSDTLTESFTTDTPKPELIARFRQRAGKLNRFTDDEVKRLFPDEMLDSFFTAGYGLIQD